MNGKLVYRLFYYFRIGYGTYLSQPVSLLAYITIFYGYLASRIPSFSMFILLALPTVLVAGIILGWLHFHKSGIFQTEIQTQTETNQFFFQATPGKEQEVSLPLQLLWLEIMEPWLKTEDQRRRHAELREKTLKLARGEKL